MKNQSFTKTRKRKISEVASRVWQQYLKSKGDRLLILDGAKYKPGVTLVLGFEQTFTIGSLRFRRSIQRSLYSTKPTKVPVVIADEFLKHEGVIEVNQ